MTRPTPAALAFARSTLPVRRVASATSIPGGFAQLLRAAIATRSTSPFAPPRIAPKFTQTYHAPMSVGGPAPASVGGGPAPASVGGPAPTSVGGGPAPISRSEILSNAQGLMNVPYVWGGTTSSGLDCSAFVSKVWGVSRHTTETLSSVAHPIAKDDLQSGDALNLTMAKDPDGDGHVRLFDRWANPEHTRMYVYEETPPRSIHHEISWDPKYQPMRRNNVVDG